MHDLSVLASHLAYALGWSAYHSPYNAIAQARYGQASSAASTGEEAKGGYLVRAADSAAEPIAYGLELGAFLTQFLDDW